MNTEIRTGLDRCSGSLILNTCDDAERALAWATTAQADPYRCGA
jgi:hypothetical protein